jgi:hypothetical protein
MRQIQRVHRLLECTAPCKSAPLALSGWDLVGALPRSPEAVAKRIAGDDTRRIEPGVSHLINVDPNAENSLAGCHGVGAVPSDR